MATAPIPAPQMGQGGPQGLPGNQVASPAPPSAGGGAGILLRLVTDTIRNMRLIAKNVPQASDEVRTINENLQSVMQKITAAQAPAQSQAPPL